MNREMGLGYEGLWNLIECGGYCSSVLWMKGRLLPSGTVVNKRFFEKIIFPWVSVVLFKIMGRNNWLYWNLMETAFIKIPSCRALHEKIYFHEKISHVKFFVSKTLHLVNIMI